MNLPIPCHLVASLKLFALDVDGVMTDGTIWYSPEGEAIKGFHSQDGYGLKALIDTGLILAIITGRNAGIVQYRAKELGIQHIFQDCQDKLAVLKQLCQKKGWDLGQVAYMGDDIPDLAAMQASALSFAPANAHPQVKKNASYVCQHSGGFGAVREVCDLLIQAKTI